MPQKHWLFKSEPDCFSIDDLANVPQQTTTWEGVRNYQSRNTLRDDVQVGDSVFFHHSSTNPPGIAGICEVVKAGYPDKTALDPNSQYFDPKSTAKEPRWFTVDVKLVEKFPELIPLSKLKKISGLENMMVCKRGARLSIQPVTADEWKIITTFVKTEFGKK